jgi:hypothetical protein
MQAHTSQSSKVWANSGRASQDIAEDAMEGWSAARYGLPIDNDQTDAWIAGWYLWHETHSS